MKKYLLNLYFVLLLNNLLFGQVEYFVKVNPTTCSYTIIDSLPGVKWIQGASSFDKVNKRYIFYGEDVNLNSHLYSIDATNGGILSNPSTVNYLSLMKFDNSTGILYGIHWLTTLATDADFVSINPTNLNYTIIHHISMTSTNGYVTFDDINHGFIFIAKDSVGNNCLFCIDAITGNVVSKPPLSSNISGIQFDNSSGTLYGLQWDNSLQTVYFVSINLANGNTTITNSLPLINSNYYYSTFDEINKRYTFVWTDSNNNRYLYTINATNGLVISNPPFPVFVSPYNLLEFEYDNSSGNLYALHWGPYGETTGVTETHNYNSEIKIYPNPSQNLSTIEYTLPQDENKGELIIYDIAGVEVKRVAVTNNSSKIIVDNSALQSGTCFYQLSTSKGSAGAKKMVVIK